MLDTKQAFTTINVYFKRNTNKYIPGIFPHTSDFLAVPSDSYFL